MGFDTYTNRALIIPLADFLNLLKPAHLRGVKLTALSNKNYIDVDYIINADSIQEARLAIWHCFMDSVKDENKQWVSPDNGFAGADLLNDLVKLVVPMEIRYVGNPYKCDEFTNLTSELKPGLYVAFECDDLFETVMTPIGKAIGSLWHQERINKTNEISPITWATGSN